MQETEDEVEKLKECLESQGFRKISNSKKTEDSCIGLQQT